MVNKECVTKLDYHHFLNPNKSIDLGHNHRLLASQRGSQARCASIFFFFFLEPYPWHMEVPRLGVQPPAYTTGTVMWDPSCVCDLHHSTGQRQILNPLSKARGWTCILKDASQIHSHWAMTGTPTQCISWCNTYEVDLPKRPHHPWIQPSLFIKITFYRK